MAELRWLLLTLGLIAVAGIYLYTRFKPRLERGMQALSARREPVFERGADNDPVIAAGPSLTPNDESETADVPGEGAAPVPPVEPKVVTIRLMARSGGGFPGDELVLKMRELGLQHGEFGIFHRIAERDEQAREFSIASLVEPGSFDLARIKADSYPGVSIFMMLPATHRDGVEVFDDMMDTSRALAKQLDGELLDEQGSSLSVQRQRYLREEVIQYQHQGIA